MVGVALNLARGRRSLVAGRPRRAGRPHPPCQRQRPARKDAPPRDRRGRPWLAAAALGVTGFASLALQVVWTRLLASMLGPTTYAFSAVVAIFILGIAGGSALGRVAVAPAPAAGRGPGAWPSPRARRWPWRRRRPSTRCCSAVAEVVARPEATFEQVVAREWAFTAAILLPMAIAFGAAFPFALSVAARDESSMVADLGVVYAVNTAGAIAGRAAAPASCSCRGWGSSSTIRLVARPAGALRGRAVARRPPAPGLGTAGPRPGRRLRPRGWCRNGIRACSRAAPTSMRAPFAGPTSSRRSPPASCSTTGRARRPPWPYGG